MTPEQNRERARIAAMRRYHPDSPETDELAADFKARRLEEHVQRVVDSAPPLSAEQRERIASVLRGVPR